MKSGRGKPKFESLEKRLFLSDSPSDPDPVPGDTWPLEVSFIYGPEDPNPDDNFTCRDNSTAGDANTQDRRLHLRIENVIPDTPLNIYLQDGTQRHLLGWDDWDPWGNSNSASVLSCISHSAGVLDVYTDGTYKIPDGEATIVAEQVVGVKAYTSEPLTLVVDSVLQPPEIESVSFNKYGCHDSSYALTDETYPSVTIRATEAGYIGDVSVPAGGKASGTVYGPVTFADVAGNGCQMIQRVLPGDGNGDSVVDDSDYTVWADNYGKTNLDFLVKKTWVKGDWNFDGQVNDADYTIWADAYNKSPMPQLSYTVTDLGNDLRGYTFTLYGASGGAWAASLTFSPNSGKTICQLLSDGSSVNTEMQARIADILDPDYNQTLDSWVYSPFFLRAGDITEANGKFSIHVGMSSGYEKTNLVYVVSDGPIQVKGNVAFRALDYSVSGWTNDLFTPLICTT